MWREKIIEAKKAQGISTKIMSERIGRHLPERTISRILSGETEFPRVDTILELGASVGLSAQEIFAETTSVVSDINLAALQAEIETLKTERDSAIAENAVLKDKIDTLKDKIDTLKDEIIAVHNYYIKQKSNN